MSGATPELESLISLGLESAMAAVHVHAPAKVLSYDADDASCSVQPLTRRPSTSDEDAVTYEDPQPVDRVRVLFPGGSGFAIKWDLAPGDIVMLAYLDFAPTGFYARGQASDAGDTRQLGPSYPVALPWYRPGGGPGATTAQPTVGPPSGVRLTFHSTYVRAGNGGDFVALAGLVLARLTTLQQAFDDHTHTVATTGTAAAQTGTAAPVASPVGALASVAASNLKADP